MELTGQKSDCPHCNGTGSIPVDDLTDRFCVCSYRRALQAHLGPEIACAPMPAASPLYVHSEKRGEPPEVDKTVRNLMIHGNWHDIIPHVKWSLIAKGLSFYTKVVTDEKLKNVWLGNEKYMARSRKNRDDDVTYNSLSDLIGENYDLLIIRLGCLGYKNIAMPGILKESLMIRQVAMLPTWLIVEPRDPFIPGHFSYSDDVHAYIAHNKFEVMRFKETEASKAASLLAPDDDGTVSLGTDTTPEQPEEPTRPQPTRNHQPSSPPTQGMNMEGLDNAPGKWKPKKKGRFGGGSGEGGL